MYVITGATGNTGSILARTLLGLNQKVRVIGRRADRLEPFTAEGAESSVCDVTDAAALTKAFSGARAVYVMIPSSMISKDYRADQDRVTNAIAQAIEQAGVKYAVSLSSVGADKPEGTGPVAGLHYLEQTLNRIPELNVLHLRAGYFMDLTFTGKQARELLGQRDISMSEVATIIGSAIGKSDLKYVQLPDEQIRTALTQMGISLNVANLILEMSAALNSGHMRALEERSPENTTPTSYESFVAEEFVSRYRGKSTGA